VSKIDAHPDHLRRSGGKLAGFGGKLAEGGQKLETAGQNLVSHASGDRSGIGAVVAKLFGKGVQITGKVFSEGGRVVEGAGKRLGTTADLYEEADGKGAGLFKKLHPGTKGDIDPHGGGGSRNSRGNASNSGSGRRFSLRNLLGGDKRKNGIEDSKKCPGGDPVDMVTGEVMLTQVDLELAGALPLVLSRSHVSSYRAGRWFGPNWASTLDQRLEIDDEGVVFAAADGMLLSYPTPLADEAPVWPEEGPRWPLRLSERGYGVENPFTGQTLDFGTDTRQLTGITDRAGNRVAIEYRPDGTPAAITRAGGFRLDIGVSDGRITDLIVQDTVVRRFGYDQQGRLAEVVNGSGLPMRFDYDADGRMTEWVDRNGMSYRYTYDSTGRCVRGDGDGGFLSYSFDYDLDNRVTKATDSLGHHTRYHFNEALQVVKTVDPLGAETISEWDRYGRLLAETDPLGRTIRYEYNEAGDPVRITRPDGSQLLAEYDERHLPVTVVGPDGAVRRQQFDEAGMLRAITDPTGAVTRYDYDDRHRLLSNVDALGAVTRYACDETGLIVEVTDPRGATTRYERDLAGRVTRVTDALGGVVTLTWTPDGQLASRTQPDGVTQRWSYDGEGNQVEYLDPARGRTRTEYGPFDQPVAQTDPAGGRTVFDYDTELRLVTVTNPAGLVWRYDYDDADNLIGETDYNGSTLRYELDAAGQLIGRTNSLGQTVRSVYDQLGRVVQRHSKGQATTFGYDEADRLVRATNADTDLVLVRDAVGRIVAETVNGRTLQSSYDPLGRRTRRVTPSGAVSSWEYDQAGNPVALHATGHTLTFEHDIAGRETQRRVGQIALAQTWDANHRLHTQALTAPDPRQRQMLLQRRAYTYRLDGTVTNIVDQLAGVLQFDLDELGRVTAVHAPDHVESYAYDPSGTLRTSSTAGEHATVGTLTRSAGATRYEHDPHGRVTTRQTRTLSGQQRTWRYTWDIDDRLVTVTTPDGIVWWYVYDALGRRVSKLRLAAEGTVAERVDFTWDGTSLAEQTHSAGHTTAWDYQPGSHIPLTQIERASQEWIDSRFYAIVTDVVGTPSELVSPAGELAWQQSSTLWGLPLAAGRSTAYCPLRFPGQYHDVETGQNYNYFRYYDPIIAGYTAADPLGLDGGPNPHVYVPNPLVWLDPLGLKKKCPLRAGEAGRFKDLDDRAVTGDNLTPHHMPQAAMKFTNRADGGAIMLPHNEHEMTRTYGGRGIGTRNADTGLSFRQVLAKDILDVRRIAQQEHGDPGYYNQGIKDLLAYYRTNFPHLMKK
jgi:RHS repeat-associated protein